MSYKDYLITGLSYLKQSAKRKLIREAYRLKGQSGIEIGGPSKFFSLKGGFPVYLFAEKIDGVNFSTDTVWEGQIKEGKNYGYYDSKSGYQYIAEATDLGKIPDNKYDFVLSCHSLEHVANPIKALMEWKRVIKAGASLVLILPDKRFTFDIARPYTSFEHLVEDYKANTDEHDTTHFHEIEQLHDRSKDPGMSPTVKMEDRLKDNYHQRIAHHHVFSQEVLKKMLEYCGFEVRYQQEMIPFHLITLAQKK
jgi:SAM-dependent methyltransferase